MSKEILFDDDARHQLNTGIKKISKAVGSTLGARGRTVLIESKFHTGHLTVTKDGISVAKAIELSEPTQDLAVRLMRQAASKTATQAGDGTTTSIVLADSIIDKAEEMMTVPYRKRFWQRKKYRKPNPKINRTEVIRHMQEFTELMVERLDSVSTKVNSTMLTHIATVSANNDTVLGNLIAEAYKMVGDDGFVKAANSKTEDTYSTITQGIQFERGLISPFHVTDNQKVVAELNHPYILVTDLEIPSVKDIEHILIEPIQNNQPIFVIGQMSNDAMEAMNHNVQKGLVKFCNVIPPDFGDRRNDTMADIAIAVGATYVSEKTGSDWGTVDKSFLGRASRVVVDRESTSIIHDKDVKTEDLNKRVSDLRGQLDTATKDSEKEALRSRIATLCGRVSTIHVGGKTEIEMKEKRDRVDDSILATKAAIEDGILPGGGIALLNLSMEVYHNASADGRVAIDIMTSAMQAPFRKILVNADKDPSSIHQWGDDEGFGYDVKNEKYGNMIEMGIIDPAKVTKQALLNATSVATSILMTSAVITNEK